MVKQRIIRLSEELGGGTLDLKMLEQAVRDAIQQVVRDYRSLGQPCNVETITEAVQERLRVTSRLR